MTSLGAGSGHLGPAPRTARRNRCIGRDRLGRRLQRVHAARPGFAAGRQLRALTAAAQVRNQAGGAAAHDDKRNNADDQVFSHSAN